MYLNEETIIIMKCGKLKFLCRIATISHICSCMVLLLSEHLLKLHTTVLEQCQQWYNELTEPQRKEVIAHYGFFPHLEPCFDDLPNGPSWLWYVIAILPLEEPAKLALLAMTSLEDRLLATQRVLGYVRSQKLS